MVGMYFLVSDIEGHIEQIVGKSPIQPITIQIAAPYGLD